MRTNAAATASFLEPALQNIHEIPSGSTASGLIILISLIYFTWSHSEASAETEFVLCAALMCGQAELSVKTEQADTKREKGNVFISIS